MINSNVKSTKEIPKVSVSIQMDTNANFWYLFGSFHIGIDHSAILLSRAFTHAQSQCTGGTWETVTAWFERLWVVHNFVACAQWLCLCLGRICASHAWYERRGYTTCTSKRTGGAGAEKSRAGRAEPPRADRQCLSLISNPYCDPSWPRPIA